MATSKSLIPVERIEKSILLIRGHKVMLDSDLAELDAETTTRLNQQVRRNMGRFPEDFAFQLTQEELDALILQIATSKTGRGGRRKLPCVFTEQGVAMLSSVLRSTRAVIVNIAIMRAFVRLREMLATRKDLARKMADLEREKKAQGKKITDVCKAIQKLIEPPPDKPRRAIGFQAPKK
ncbi:ORF6N domain-containing protein [candidate division KSB1 bacterium]|nr:ORF6N domain-containing protein [candidate division KSB1 bacterium]